MSILRLLLLIFPVPKFFFIFPYLIILFVHHYIIYRIYFKFFPNHMDYFNYYNYYNYYFDYYYFKYYFGNSYNYCLLEP